ncbi:hypothetical protein [Haloplanus halophilus]|uniref:hypothetical protein n=1 Tax=Haloplanus halophilus TaxID=2949993 RepID=UPI00203B0B70|nr:hypothetical protein [Haloplanus sp. GDY1]
MLGRSGATGTRLLGAGLIGGFLALFANAIYPDALFKLLVVGLPLFVGGICVALGTLLLAYRLWHLSLVSTPLAAIWGLAVPASLALNAAITPHTNAGIGLYGLAWIIVGVHLWRTTGDVLTVDERGRPRAACVTWDVTVVTAGLGGAALSIVGAGGFVPLGPITGIAFVGLTPPFDAFHLVTGLCGLGTVAVRRPRYATLYDRYAGLGYLVLALVLLGQVLTPYRLVTAHWSLLFLHFPIGILLTVAGFAGSSRSE